MKNNRKIEVGQVRQVDDEADTNFREMYYISKLDSFKASGIILTGKNKGRSFECNLFSVEEHIVVM